MPLENLRSPLFCDTSKETLQKINHLLDLASFHRASEQTGEWSLAQEPISKAVGLMFDDRWSYTMISLFINQAGPYLVTADELANSLISMAHLKIHNLENPK